MITIAWYNVVAIVALVAWLFWASQEEHNDFGINALIKLRNYILL